MAIIVIESIGFCATHSISEMLRMNGKNFVSHGTKNFFKNTPIGVEDLSFEEFHNQMLHQSDQYQNCISVHSNYSPDVIAKLVDDTDTHFVGLMRKSQFKQILSCFYWAANGLLNGREDFVQILSAVQNQHGNSIRQIGLPVNMNSCLMFYAFQYVVGFNLGLMNYASKILFMEDVITNPKLIADLIGVDQNAKPLNVGKGPSHKNKLKDLQFFSNTEEILDIIMTKLNIKVGTSHFKVKELEQLFIKKSVSNN